MNNNYKNLIMNRFKIYEQYENLLDKYLVSLINRIDEKIYNNIIRPNI